MENNNIRRVQSLKDILIEALLLIAGICCFTISSDRFGILGVVFIATAIILVFCLKSSFRLGDDKTAYKRVTIDFSINDKDQLKRFLQGESDQLPAAKVNGGATVYAYLTSDKSAGYARIMTFGSSYEYRAYTDLLPLDEAKIQKLLSL